MYDFGDYRLNNEHSFIPQGLDHKDQVKAKRSILDKGMADVSRGFSELDVRESLKTFNNHEFSYISRKAIDKVSPEEQEVKSKEEAMLRSLLNQIDEEIGEIKESKPIFGALKLQSTKTAATAKMLTPAQRLQIAQAMNNIKAGRLENIRTFENGKMVKPQINSQEDAERFERQPKVYIDQASRTYIALDENVPDTLNDIDSEGKETDYRKDFDLPEEDRAKVRGYIHAYVSQQLWRSSAFPVATPPSVESQETSPKEKVRSSPNDFSRTRQSEQAAKAKQQTNTAEIDKSRSNEKLDQEKKIIDLINKREELHILLRRINDKLHIEHIQLMIISEVNKMEMDREIINLEFLNKAKHSVVDEVEKTELIDAVQQIDVIIKDYSSLKKDYPNTSFYINRKSLVVLKQSLYRCYVQKIGTNVTIGNRIK